MQAMNHMVCVKYLIAQRASIQKTERQIPNFFFCNVDALEFSFVVMLLIMRISKMCLPGVFEKSGTLCANLVGT